MGYQLLLVGVAFVVRFFSVMLEVEAFGPDTVRIR
jgi:hypothetical protein